MRRAIILTFWLVLLISVPGNSQLSPGTIITGGSGSYSKGSEAAYHISLHLSPMISRKFAVGGGLLLMEPPRELLGYQHPMTGTEYYFFGRYYLPAFKNQKTVPFLLAEGIFFDEDRPDPYYQSKFGPSRLGVGGGLLMFLTPEAGVELRGSIWFPRSPEEEGVYTDGSDTWWWQYSASVVTCINTGQSNRAAHFTLPKGTVMLDLQLQSSPLVMLPTFNATVGIQTKSSILIGTELFLTADYLGARPFIRGVFDSEQALKWYWQLMPGLAWTATVKDNSGFMGSDDYYGHTLLDIRGGGGFLYFLSPSVALDAQAGYEASFDLRTKNRTLGPVFQTGLILFLKTEND